jgi:hypothetical protein
VPQQCQAPRTVRVRNHHTDQHRLQMIVDIQLDLRNHHGIRVIAQLLAPIATEYEYHDREHFKTKTKRFIVVAVAKSQVKSLPWRLILLVSTIRPVLSTCFVNRSESLDL